MVLMTQFLFINFYLFFNKSFFICHFGVKMYMFFTILFLAMQSGKAFLCFEETGDAIFTINK